MSNARVSMDYFSHCIPKANGPVYASMSNGLAPTTIQFVVIFCTQQPATFCLEAVLTWKKKTVSLTWSTLSTYSLTHILQNESFTACIQIKKTITANKNDCKEKKKHQPRNYAILANSVMFRCAVIIMMDIEMLHTTVHHGERDVLCLMSRISMARREFSTSNYTKFIGLTTTSNKINQFLIGQ